MDVHLTVPLPTSTGLLITGHSTRQVTALVSPRVRASPLAPRHGPLPPAKLWDAALTLCRLAVLIRVFPALFPRVDRMGLFSMGNCDSLGLLGRSCFGCVLLVVSSCGGWLEGVREW